MASYDAVAACLRNGRWETLPTSHSLAHILQPTTHFRFACRDPMQTMQRHRWKPDDPSCSGILELDPLAASFGGMFADPERGELHTDCTHWCHPTEMGVHMAAAVLNVMAALLRDQQQHERRPHEHHHGGAHEQQRRPPA